MNLISSLPNEILFMIQGNFDRNSALSYSCTSHTCKNLLFSNDEAWKKLFFQVSFPTTLTPKNYLDLHAVSSIQQLDKLFKQFSKKLALRQKGRFTCLFPFNNNLKLKVNLKFKSKIRGFALINASLELSIIKPVKLPTFKETYIYMHALDSVIIAENANFKSKSSYNYEIDRSFPCAFLSENSIKKKISHSFIEDTVNRIANRELVIKAENFYKRAAKLEYLKLAAFIGTFALTCLFINLSIK